MKRVHILLFLFLLNTAGSLACASAPPFAFHFTEPNKDSAQAFYNRGMQKVNAGDFVEAVQFFTKAIQFDSTMVMAYLNRGHAKNKLLDFKGAITDYNRAIKLKNLTWEESYEAYFNRGLALASLENMRSALSNFDHAIRLNPQYADAYYNRSIL